MEDLVYLDEELPEITIRELVDDRDGTVFVSLDDSHIEGLASDLYGNMDRGTDFLKMLKTATNTTNGLSLFPFAQYKVSAGRVQNNDDSSSDDDEERGELYLDTMQKLFKVPYSLRQTEMDRISMPFTATEAAASATGNVLLLKSSDLPSPVHIHLINNDTSVLTVQDNTSLPLQSAAWSPPIWTFDSYITEPLVNRTTGQSLDLKKPKRTHSDMNAFLLSIRPDLVDILPKHHIDLHQLKVVLSQNAFSYESLTENQLAIIAEALLQYTDSDTDSDSDIDVPKKTTKSSHAPLSDTTHEDAIEGHQTRADAYMTDSRRQQMQSMFDQYISAHPQFSLSDGIDAPIKMVSSLLQGTTTVAEIVTSLKDIRERVNTKLMRDFFISLIPEQPSAFPPPDQDVDENKDKDHKKKKHVVAAMATAVAPRPKPVVEDMNQRVFMSSYSDIEEIKMGSDTSMYVGTRTIPVVFVDESYAAEPSAPLYSDDDDFTETPTLPPPNVAGLARSPDHLSKVFMDIQKIVDISGLPWDYDKWLATSRGLTSYAFPPSRFDRIRVISSEISEFVIANIASSSSLDAGLHEIGKMSNEKEAAIIRDKYPGIFKEWYDTCKYVLVDGLTFWAMDVLEKSLLGTLDFKLPNNIYGHYWSPFGYPVESSKSTRGVFIYISHISGLPHAALTDHAASEYSEQVASMKENKKSRRRDKVDDINKQFIDALEQHNKSKKDPEFFLRSFVPMYLHLPSLVKQKVPSNKQPIWAQGCCITPLGETYEADADFRYTDPKKKEDTSLYYIKFNLGNKKWLKAARPMMKVMQRHSTHDVDAVKPNGIMQLPHDVTAPLSPDFDIAAALADIAPSEHIADYEKGQTAFNNHVTAIVKRALTSRRLLDIMNNIVDSTDLDANHYKNMIKALVIQDTSLLEFKRRVDTYPDIPSQPLKYMLATMMERIEDKDKAVATLKQLKAAYVLPTPENVQDFINKRREEQKEIKRRLLDVLNIDDRETVMQARKLGILNYANLPDMAPADEGGPGGAGGGNDDFDAEGEAEFAQRPTDDDRDDE